jgi:hypothetical protein
MATSLLDLNSAPPEQLDGELVPAEGEAAADEEGDAPTEAAGTSFILYLEQQQIQLEI